MYSYSTILERPQALRDLSAQQRHQDVPKLNAKAKKKCNRNIFQVSNEMQDTTTAQILISFGIDSDNCKPNIYLTTTKEQFGLPKTSMRY